MCNMNYNLNLINLYTTKLKHNVFKFIYKKIYILTTPTSAKSIHLNVVSDFYYKTQHWNFKMWKSSCKKKDQGHVHAIVKY